MSDLAQRPLSPRYLYCLVPWNEQGWTRVDLASNEMLDSLRYSCFYSPIAEASVSPMGLNSLSCRGKSISVKSG